MLKDFVHNNSSLLETRRKRERDSSVYSLQDKPWVYAHLLEIQRKLGRENFPLIEQAFYPTHRDMVTTKLEKQMYVVN